MGRTGEAMWADLVGSGLAFVDEASLLSTFVPTDIVRRVGLPIAQMWIWGEDIEYTRRMSAVAPGVLVANSTVLHARAIVGAPNIFTETDPSRIERFWFAYRNYLYVCRKYLGWTLLANCIVRNLQTILRLLFTGEVKKASMVTMGVVAGLLFEPTIAGIDQR
jgi:dTDP-4-dehydrorhamnose reductase